MTERIRGDEHADPDDDAELDLPRSSTATAVDELDGDEILTDEAEGASADPEEWDDDVTPSDPEARLRLERAVSWIVVASCAGFVLWSLHVDLLLRDTTPTGGDMGAHVWGPRFLADHLLPDLRVTGWTPDWYAGFPAYVFYMVVPSLMIVWLATGPPAWLSPVLMAALVAAAIWANGRLRERWARQLMWVAAAVLALLVLPIPYNVAFKLVTVAGLVTLPIAAYALARAARAPFPAPPLAAMATLPFIYDKGFTILGGNGASTMAGEFAFSISLTFALLYLAVVFRGIRTGRDRALGATLLGLTILCHLIPAIFAGIATAVLLFVRREDREPWWDGSRVGRIVAAVLVLVTLATIMPPVRLPFGAVVSSPLPQWWFPALGTAVALVLFTGFEPRLVRWWLTPPGRIVGALVLLGAAALLITRSGWMTITVVAVALAVTFFSGWDDRLVRWLLLAAPVGVVVTGFWSVPFLLNSTYMNDMGWEKYTQYHDYLLADPSLDSGGMPYRNVVYALAGLGVLLSLIHRVRFGWFLTLTVVAFAWIFRYFPQYRLWNARLLPFLYLGLYLLAGLAVALALRSVALAVSELRERDDESVAVTVAGTSLVGVLLAVVLLAGFRMLPGGEQTTAADDPSHAVYRWAGIDFETSIVTDWSRHNYEGLEGKPAYPEYAGIVDMMERVADEHGCGRAMWEYEKELDRFGTPMALMLLPYFTDGCIGSMEGLYFEASSTTPFHFLNQSALSAAPSRAQRDLRYSDFDIDLGVAQLQMLGVRYYMATSETAIAAARQHPDLTEVATESFAAAPTADGLVEHHWAVFLVEGSDVVTGLERTPVVLSDADDHIDGWVYSADVPEQVEGQLRRPKDPGPAAEWFQDPSRWDVHLATGGPREWPRGSASEAGSLGEELPDVEVSDVELGTDSVSFRVDRTGVPVLVKVSYFPNWRADGAEGPWRVSPNFMVVVPTDEHVTLSYGQRSVDLLGWVLAVLGVAGIGGLALLDVRARRRIEQAQGEEAPAEEVDDPEPALP